MRRQRFRSHRDYALFVAFADDVDETGFEMKLLQSQAAQFGQAQPGRIGQFQHRLVAKVGAASPGSSGAKQLLISAAVSALGSRFQRRGSERFSAGFAGSIFSFSANR